MHCARDPGLGEMYALVRSEALLAQRLDRLTHQVLASAPELHRTAWKCGVMPRLPARCLHRAEVPQVLFSQVLIDWGNCSTSCSQG